jgi:hypothetical protein
MTLATHSPRSRTGASSGRSDGTSETTFTTLPLESSPTSKCSTSGAWAPALDQHSFSAARAYSGSQDRKKESYVKIGIAFSFDGALEPSCCVLVAAVVDTDGRSGSESLMRCSAVRDGARSSDELTILAAMRMDPEIAAEQATITASARLVIRPFAAARRSRRTRGVSAH